MRSISSIPLFPISQSVSADKAIALVHQICVGYLVRYPHFGCALVSQRKGLAMDIPRRKFLRLAAGAATLPALPRVARAQAYPSRPVRIVVGFPAGGAHDVQARLIGQWLTDRFGKPFVVENRPGAGGTIGTEAVVRAQPDGYSFIVLGTANTLSALAAEKLSYDVVRDLSPVAGLNTNMFLLLVNPKLPVTTVPELIAYCKANPGKLNFGSAGIGTVQHIGIELFKMMAGVDLTHVPYRGEAPQVTDLIG